ncbi:hypothetical protein C8R43DRAFT_947152 [Mycena crocata]|nr:hypothetical protein C8R43DRAFT_947152 [Mycena crocata]
MLANAFRRRTGLILPTAMGRVAPSLDPFLAHRIPVTLRCLSTRKFYRTREFYRQKERQCKQIAETPPKEYPSNRKLFFWASLDITESSLRAILAPYGPMGFLYIQFSRGFGLVAFTEQKSADAALGASLSIPGVRLAYAVPDNPPSLAVHISNLPPSSTEEELHAALAQYGEIVTCRIEERNKSNKRRGGHALVIFADQSAADAACKAGICIFHETRIGAQLNCVGDMFNVIHIPFFIHKSTKGKQMNKIRIQSWSSRSSLFSVIDPWAVEMLRILRRPQIVNSARLSAPMRTCKDSCGPTAIEPIRDEPTVLRNFAPRDEDLEMQPRFGELKRRPGGKNKCLLGKIV